MHRILLHTRENAVNTKRATQGEQDRRYVAERESLLATLAAERIVWEREQDARDNAAWDALINRQGSES